MSDCPICQHEKLPAITDALANGRRIGVVAHQYRVAKLDLVKHCQHTPIGSHDITRVDEFPSPQDFSSSSLDDLPPLDESQLGAANLQDEAERQFRNGWRLMNDQRRAKNLAWLQERLQETAYEVTYE